MYTLLIFSISHLLTPYLCHLTTLSHSLLLIYFSCPNILRKICFLIDLIHLRMTFKVNKNNKPIKKNSNFPDEPVKSSLVSIKGHYKRNLIMHHLFTKL